MMPSYALCFSLLIYIVSKIPTTTVTASTTPAYTATDFILLNCGASTNLHDNSNRSWDGDERSSYAPTTIYSSSTAAISASDQVPYDTARVFHSSFRYTFPVATGSKFVRLYFCSNISDIDNSQSFFTVTANAFTLLRNFSASLYSQNSSQFSFMKEFVINIQVNQQLNLTFSPKPNSFAFVNGIEIVSIPDKLYFRENNVPIKFVEENAQQFYLDNRTSVLENLYRLNVGGSRVEIKDDSGPTRGMFRAWSGDDEFFFSAAVDNNTRQAPENLEIKYTSYIPPYTAPDIVYTTARVTTDRSVSLEWRFPVDSGFYYLLRFHFCEFTPGVTKSKQRVFTIVINNMAAEIHADVVNWAGGTQMPIFMDYLILLPDLHGRRGKQFLWLSLLPHFGAQSSYKSALLNGLEIFKLNDSGGSLAAANPELPVKSFPPTTAAVKPQEQKKNPRSSVIYAAMGSVIVVLAVVGILCWLISQRKHQVKKPSYSTAANSSWLPLSNTSRITSGESGVSQPSKLCTYFSLHEIKTATCNFNSNFIIGKGGFGYVYRGIIDNGGTTVAIKRLNPLSNQGAREFLTEIQMLSKLRHLHLVSLIGYCDEEGEMILVYDYMAHGSLRDHLYNSENSPLSWKQRLQICMGAAKGLHYLHTGAEHAIIHRDVKSTNILIDENWVAKISDFGLSRMGQSNDSFTHISTNVKGTFGYLDPKYLSTNQLTRKSDVYSFGVVLFEVLSGRPAVDVRLDEEQHSLAGWARCCIREGKVDGLIDHNLMGQISAACLETFVGIAGRCIHILPLERPTMADVVMGLELSLALQETTSYTAEQVEEGDDAGIIYSDRSEIVISTDDITDSKGESDRIISEDNPISSTRKNQSDYKKEKWMADLICSRELSQKVSLAR